MPSNVNDVYHFNFFVYELFVSCLRVFYEMFMSEIFKSAPFWTIYK